jgi:hypothetical protein
MYCGFRIYVFGCFVLNILEFIFGNRPPNISPREIGFKF